MKTNTVPTTLTLFNRITKNIKLVIRFVFLSLLITTCIRCNTPKKVKNLVEYEVETDSIDAFLASQMDSLNIHCLSFALINGDKVVHHKTLGLANVEKKLPVTGKTIFEAASMSKSIFSTLVMTYVEDGTLDLDKPLYEYFPHPDLLDDERHKKITARMILSHRSGLPNWRENEEGGKLRIKFDPGTNYEYSGEGYQYLAMVLKSILGGDWSTLEAAFQERIAKPLGMTNTTFIENEDFLKLKAEPYDKQGNWIDWKNDYWYKKDKGRFVPAASVRSESLDFSKWMIGVMNKKILSEDSYGEILKKHSKTATLSTGMSVYYALGFLTLDKEYENIYIHGGINDGFSCYYVMNMNNNVGFVVFTNSMQGERFGNIIWSYLEKQDK